jgi:hypothetical protein
MRTKRRVVIGFYVDASEDLSNDLVAKLIRDDWALGRKKWSSGVGYWDTEEVHYRKAEPIVTVVTAGT